MQKVELSIIEELQLLTTELQRHFSVSYLEDLARKTGFTQRKRKWKVQDFISLCVFLNQKISATPLTKLCCMLQETTNLCITTESLNQRFNSSAVRLLQRIFLNLFQIQTKKSLSCFPEVLRLFTRIRILDSTSFQLPNTYESTYKGHGGGAKKSALKIQLEYDIISGDFLQLDITNGVSHDAKYGQQCIHTVEKRDLCIRDLGYFYLPDFHEINQKGAYYLSRLPINTQVYRKNDNLYERLYLEDLIEELSEGETIELFDVYIGKQHKVPTRLIIYKLTGAEWEKRTKNRAEYDRKNDVSKATKYKRRVSILMTNIPTDILQKEHLYSLYAVRWQIEILFKTWKSLCGIHLCKHVKLERFQCHLYGQLIAILLHSTLMFRMRKFLYLKRKQELSEYKVTYIIRMYLVKIYDALFRKSVSLFSILFQMFELIQMKGMKARRYHKPTVFNILGLK